MKMKCGHFVLTTERFGIFSSQTFLNLSMTYEMKLLAHLVLSGTFSNKGFRGASQSTAKYWKSAENGGSESFSRDVSVASNSTD
jgi:hypothetical protein